MRHRHLAFSVLLLAIAGGALAAREPVVARIQAREIARLAPGLDPELVRHLVADSDDEWLAYCRTLGAGALSNAFQTLRFAIVRSTTYAEFLERREPVLRVSLRVGDGFLHVFGFTEPRRSIEYELRLSPERHYELQLLDREWLAVLADTSLAPTERLRRIDDIVRDYRGRGAAYRAILTELSATPIELEAGRPDRHRARLEGVLRTARHIDQAYVLSQVLGDIGVLHWNAGHADSMRACFDEGIATALRHGFLDNAARLLRFDAVFHAEQGRLALALHRLAEAQRLCDRPGGESTQLRLHVEYTKFVARLGCWDLVDRSLRRVPPLLRAFPRVGRLDAAKFVFDTDRLRARLAFATGQPDRASTLMHAIQVPAAHRRVGYAELFDEWSAGLEGAHRPREAMGVCERGLAHCDSAHVPEHAIPLLLRKARLLGALGRLEEALATIDTVDTALVGAAPRNARHKGKANVVRARLILRQGRNAEARHLIDRVLRDFRARLRQGDAGALSHLELEDALSLRDAMHEIQRFTPAEGYRFELEWRSLSREIGGARRDAKGSSRRWNGAGHLEGDPPSDATHVVFHFMGDALLRWTAHRGHVSLDTLSLSSSQCLRDVREVLEILQSEEARSGNLLGPKALEKLRPLSRLLLPPEESYRSRTRPLYVSADGPLSALPFEALLVSGPNGERPVAASRDVAYVNGLDEPRAWSRGRVVVVSNPKLSVDFQRRHGWNLRLLESTAEIDAIRARWPDADFLSGELATKRAVLARLPGASLIYLAAHHVRDPDAPFLGFVPLAAPADSAPGADFMEVADIHELDLSRCRLAVLASCASGAPYRLALQPGTSLGDAFLDSGAGAVVQSFWDVEDRDARAFMDAFLATWRENGSDVAALGRARRQVMRTAAGASPRVWAAWSIKTPLPGGTSSPLAAR